MSIVESQSWRMKPSDYLSLLEETKPSLCAELFVVMPRSAPFDETVFRTYLMENQPSLFFLMDNIERGYVTAYDNARENHKNLIEMWVCMEREAQEEHNRMMTSIVPDALRDLEENPDFFFPEEEENSPLWELKQWYVSKEAMAAFEEDAFTEHATGTQLKCPLTFPTVYNCSSLWMAEELEKALVKRGIFCALVKSRSIPADLDMLRWKVCSVEPYIAEPEGRPKRRRKK